MTKPSHNPEKPDGNIRLFFVTASVAALCLLLQSGFAFAENQTKIPPDDCYLPFNKMVPAYQIAVTKIAVLPADVQTSKKQYSPHGTYWFVQSTDWHSHRHGPDADTLYVGSPSLPDKIFAIAFNDMASDAQASWQGDDMLKISVFTATQASAELVFDGDQGTWVSQKLRSYLGDGCE